jgi:Family of unknown function (DUF5995)
VTSVAGVAIGATAEELRTIARSATDASGYFPAMYSCVTDRIAASIERGEFDDGARMDEFACTFASYYTRARHREVPRPRCWRASWAVAGDGGLLIVQHLLLGINAHVNYDLPFAVVAVADKSGQSLESVRRDFEAVNDVLEDTCGEVLHRLDRVSRWTNEAASLGGGGLFNFSLRRARRQAWEAAERVHRLDSDGRQRYAAALDWLVAVLAYLIIHPAWPLRPLVWTASKLEQHDPAKVTSALLGEA